MSDARKRTQELLANLDGLRGGHLDIANKVKVRRIETPSIGLTESLNGGWGFGRHNLLWGPKSAGKSTFALRQIAIAQSLGLTTAYFDVEKTFDVSWAERQGVDTEALIYSNTGTMQAWVNDGVALLRAGVDVIVTDSLSALLPAAYVDDSGELKPFEKTGAIASLARDLGPALSQLSYANEDTLMLSISQVRMAQKGSMYWGASPMGGNALEHAMSQSVRLMSSGSNDNTIYGEIPVGDRIIRKPIARKVRYVVDKNKLGPERGEGDYSLYYDGDFVGIDNTGELLEIATNQGIVIKAGAWYSYDGNHIGQGKEKASAFLRENPDVFNAIREKVT